MPKPPRPISFSTRYLSAIIVPGRTTFCVRPTTTPGSRSMVLAASMVSSWLMARSAKRRRRKNLDAPEPMEALLDRAGEDRFAKRRPPIPMREWKLAVGPRIADRAHPITLERGILLVKVTTSVWANELQMLAPELVARLRVDRKSTRLNSSH